MSFDLEFEDDLEQRRLQRLEHRLRRAETALAGARSLYGALRELPNATELQRHRALQQVERAQRHLADIQFDLDLAEARVELRRGPVDHDFWNDIGG
jgi:hypothetical protein